MRIRIDSFNKNSKQLKKKQNTIATIQHTLTTKQRAIETKERQLQQTQQQLRDSQQLVAQFQQSLQHKEKTISDLQHTVSHHEREIQQLKQQDIANNFQSQQLPVTAEKTQTATAVPVGQKGISKMTWRGGKKAPDIMLQQDIASCIQPQQLPVTAEKTQTATAVSVGQKDISKMTWREVKKAPDIMFRGAAVVHGNTAYFTPYGSFSIHSYKNILGKEQWSKLPDNPNKKFGLTVISGLLTSVGGYNSHDIVDTNIVLSLSGEWSEVFPLMPTPRSHTACIYHY